MDNVKPPTQFEVFLQAGSCQRLLELLPCQGKHLSWARDATTALAQCTSHRHALGAVTGCHDGQE